MSGPVEAVIVQARDGRWFARVTCSGERWYTSFEPTLGCACVAIGESYMRPEMRRPSPPTGCAG